MAIYYLQNFNIYLQNTVVFYAQDYVTENFYIKGLFELLHFKYNYDNVIFINNKQYDSTQKLQ